jgi:hypothetical protein
LFEVLLPDRHKLWPDWLRKIDTLLEDDAVIEVVAQGLEARWPQSRRRGRPETPAEVVTRPANLEAPVRLELRRSGTRGARQGEMKRSDTDRAAQSEIAQLASGHFFTGK